MYLCSADTIKNSFDNKRSEWLALIVRLVTHGLFDC